MSDLFLDVLHEANNRREEKELSDAYGGLTYDDYSSSETDDLEEFVKLNPDWTPPPKPEDSMERFNEDSSNYLGCPIIIVPTQRDKDQYLLALEYLHNRWDIDTDYLGVNALVHMYEHPENIIVCDGKLVKNVFGNKVEGNENQ